MRTHSNKHTRTHTQIVAPGLEHAVAGTSLFVVGPDDDEEELKDAVMEDMAVRVCVCVGGGGVDDLDDLGWALLVLVGDLAPAGWLALG